MNNFYFIGIDVSKKKLDFCILSQGKFLVEEVVPNHQAAITRFITDFQKEYNVSCDEFLICAEHTGQYTYLLACACDVIGCNLWLETPNQIKFSSGMQRGKNDKIDARRIATYASRFADRQMRHKMPTIEIEKLDQLAKERELYGGETTVRI